ncbi:hypothetical protein N6Y36_04820 [Morganella morganii]|uniref:hypothetical protein n=1 Tax=Morganella morganii TaxID=582 RepID=UPI00220DB08A|nr:hypothetical protein N6Y36_04820 [Morganella morganii]
MKDENTGKVISFITKFGLGELLDFIELNKLIKSSNFSMYCEIIAEKTIKCGDVTPIEGLVFLFIKKGNSNFNGVLEWFSLRMGRKLAFKNGRVKIYKSSKIEFCPKREKPLISVAF